MANNISGHVVRVTDGELVSAMLRISEAPETKPITAIRVAYSSGDPLEVARADWEDSEALTALRSAKSCVLRAVTLAAGPSDLVHVRRNLDGRNQEGSLFDDLTLYVDKFPGDELEFVKFSSVVQSELRRSQAADLGPLLGKGMEEHFAAREQALNRLETLVVEQNKQLDEQRKLLDEQYDKRVTELEETYNTKQEELAAGLEKREAKLREGEKELEARIKEVDDRQATHARREDRKRLLEAITQDDRLKVSDQTIWRRAGVIAAYCLLLTFFGLICYALYSTPLPDGTTSYLAIASRFGAVLGTVTTAGFFIRWLNAFAARSADEDFKLKQLQLDVERASWLVELYFESKSAGENGEFPEQLLNQLSKNLFVTEDTDAGTVTATDALATALLESAGKVRLNVGGNEVELNRGSMKKLKRKSLGAESE